MTQNPKDPVRKTLKITNKWSDYSTAYSYFFGRNRTRTAVQYGRTIYLWQISTGEVSWPSIINVALISEYDGEFYDGLRHGSGTLYYADGSILQGQFLFGKANGRGLLQRQSD